MGIEALRVTARTSPRQGLVLEVEGYLDEDGGMMLSRETRAAPAEEQRHICIDLAEVRLFNLSGARRLIRLITDLEELGYEVELAGVHPPLQRLLDLSR